MESIVIPPVSFSLHVLPKSIKTRHDDSGKLTSHPQRHKLQRHNRRPLPLPPPSKRHPVHLLRLLPAPQRHHPRRPHRPLRNQHPRPSRPGHERPRPPPARRPMVPDPLLRRARLAVPPRLLQASESLLRSHDPAAVPLLRLPRPSALLALPHARVPRFPSVEAGR